MNTLRGKKVLVIDDEEILTRTFSRLLEVAGYDVLTAKRGSDAVEAAEEDTFDLIICDIRMPGLDGIETVIKLRETFRRRGQICPPEIFITGYADLEVEGRARELNPGAYVRKPFENQLLLDKVEELLKKQPSQS